MGIFVFDFSKSAFDLLHIPQIDNCVEGGNVFKGDLFYQTFRCKNIPVLRRDGDRLIGMGEGIVKIHCKVGYGSLRCTQVIFHTGIDEQDTAFLQVIFDTAAFDDGCALAHIK